MNWLVKARTAAGKAEAECACALRMTADEYADAERHPGTLTINEVGMLARLFGKDAARTMLAGIGALYVKARTHDSGHECRVGLLGEHDFAIV